MKERVISLVNKSPILGIPWKDKTLLMGAMMHPSSFYALRILLPLFISCTGWNMIRRTLSEAAPKLIESKFLDQTNYATLNTLSFVVYGLTKFATSHIVKSRLFSLYSILFTIVGVFTFVCGMLCLQGPSMFPSFFCTWVLTYMCMGTLWPIICIIFKQWIPNNRTILLSD